MTINYLTPNDSYLMNLNIIPIIIFKPFTICLICYILHLFKFKNKVTIIEFLLTITLIYQISFLIEITINSFTNYTSILDLMSNMSENNNVPNDNTPRNRYNPDIPRLIRYLSTNVAALMARRPMSRALGLTIVNAGNILADVVSNEERANYWIDQYNFFRANGIRGGLNGTGPFERGTNPFETLENDGNSNIPDSGDSSKVISHQGDSSNFIGNFDFIRDLFSPVDHSIPLDTLLNVHLVMILGLFVLTLALILIIIYLYVNLIILFNKDFFLNKVKNKYVLLYTKYVVFKTRIDIIVICIIILVVLCYMVYILHYLIVHPIVIN
jgi:hypothetical protein